MNETKPETSQFVSNRCTRREVLATGLLSTVCFPRVVSGQGAEPSDDWPMQQRDAANTGRQTASNALRDGVHVAWRTSTGTKRPTGPVATHDTVYVGNFDGTVSAYDAADGTNRWTSELGADPAGVPAIWDDSLFVGIDLNRDDQRLYALDVTDGSVRWRSEATLRGPHVTVSDGIVYARGKGQFCAIDAASGKTLWKVDQVTLKPVPPAVVDGTVVLTEKEVLSARDATDGTEQWQYDFGGFINGAPTVAGDTVYFVHGNLRGRLLALNLADGTERWRKPLDWHAASSPAVADDTVFVGGVKESIYAFDATDGTRRWRISNQGMNASAPAVVGDTLLFTSLDKHLYAVSTDDGSRRWRFGGDNAFLSPAVANGRIYVGTGDGTLYALAPGRTPLSIPGFGAFGGAAAVGAAAAHRLSSGE